MKNAGYTSDGSPRPLKYGIRSLRNPLMHDVLRLGGGARKEVKALRRQLREMEVSAEDNGSRC